jgi:hypothetical protein
MKKKIIATKEEELIHIRVDADLEKNVDSNSNASTDIHETTVKNGKWKIHRKTSMWNGNRKKWKERMREVLRNNPRKNREIATI